MAELHQVSINEMSEEENISLEQQDAMQEEAKAQRGESAKPAWLPEKFKDAADMAKAYKELEAKLSSGKDVDDESESTDDDDTVEETEEEEEEVSPIVASIDSASEEYEEKGELSEKTYKKLESSGLPRDLVDAYIAGQEALVTQQTNQVMDAVGGEGNYVAMAEWAEENLSKQEIEAYDEMVTNGSLEQATMAARGLFAQFRSGGGVAPTLLQGSTSGSAVKPFASAAQVTEAMRDARYKNDPAYRQTVEQRLAVTTAF
jgi:hypothetical protein